MSTTNAGNLYMSRSWTPTRRSFESVQLIGKTMHRALLMSCMVLFVSSCGFSFPDLPSIKGKQNQTDTPAPSASSKEGTETIAPIALPPQSGNPDDQNDKPSGLQPPRGVNTSALFPAGLEDPNARIKRLENAVQLMRNDFDKMAPAINRLTAVESDIQELLVELEALIDDEPPPSSKVEQQALD